MRHVITSLFLLIIIFLSVNCFAVSFNEKSYIAVIDAGSTGSRIYVYSYQLSDLAHIAKLTEIFNASVKPGLSAYAKDPEQAGVSLQPLLDGAENAIQQAGGDVKQTPLTVLATAGVRKLPISQQKAILENVRQFLHRYQFQVKAVKTISGWLEGIYGWITVNALKHLLNTQLITEGALEMGGASTQIAFETPSRNEYVHTFQIANNIYRVFSYSFLNLGQNQALVQLNKYGDVSYCYPKDYSYSNDEVGRFNYRKCRAIVAREVNSFHVKQIVPAISRRMIYAAFSGYYYTFNFFKANSSLLKLMVKTIGVCDFNSWEQLKNEYPNQPDKYLSQYCFSATLILNLLRNEVGYGFKDNYHNLAVCEKINNKNVDWVYGAALYEIEGSGLA